MSKKIRRSLDEKEFVVSVRLGKKDYEKIEAKAVGLGITRSFALRIAIKEFLNAPTSKFGFLK
jgi:hypothetical protein